MKPVIVPPDAPNLRRRQHRLDRTLARVGAVLIERRSVRRSRTSEAAIQGEAQGRVAERLTSCDRRPARATDQFSSLPMVFDSNVSPLHITREQILIVLDQTRLRHPDLNCLRGMSDDPNSAGRLRHSGGRSVCARYGLMYGSNSALL